MIGIVWLCVCMFQLSILKCGLLPVCYESMILGEISYADCFGSLGDANSCHQLINSFGNDSKVMNPMAGIFALPFGAFNNNY